MDAARRDMTPDGSPTETVTSSLYGDTRIGLIDIGSNSIRLVIYRAGGRLPIRSSTNAKSAALAKGWLKRVISLQTGLNMHFRRWPDLLFIIGHSNLDRIDIFATEAVRKAANKDAFLIPAETILGHPIRVLEGVEEAIYATRGVISGFVYVDGIVADLGGGSLELSSATPDRPVTSDYSVSLPLGHLNDVDSSKIVEMISNVDWVAAQQSKRLYVVGGTWRAIATAHAAQSRKRVDIVHGFTLTRKSLFRFLDTIEASEGEIGGIPPARRGSMVQAIKVLRGLMEVHDTEKVVFSSYGAREGILFDGLDNRQQGIDPLLEGVAEIAVMSQRFEDLGKVLSACINPLNICPKPISGLPARPAGWPILPGLNILITEESWLLKRCWGCPWWGSAMPSVSGWRRRCISAIPAFSPEAVFFAGFSPKKREEVCLFHRSCPAHDHDGFRRYPRDYRKFHDHIKKEEIIYHSSAGDNAGAGHTSVAPPY